MIAARGLSTRVVGVFAVLRWYLREVSGESAYERYLSHRHQGDVAPVLTRREFERHRLEDSCTPGRRCC